MRSDHPRLPRQRWDLFCRVVDNLGDAAILWRLARQLAAEHGRTPRLWIDDPAALARLVPGARAGARVDGVRIERWDDADPRLAHTPQDEVADVVIGGFACHPPAAYRAAMQTSRPAWIDLEYLSAEPWVDTHHGLPSPKPDGLVEHFYFPGPSAAAGGLLREADLIVRRDAFVADPRARDEFLGALGVRPAPGERFASMFCYPGSPLAPVFDALAADRADGRWRVLLPQGVAPDAPDHPIVQRVPFVPQRDYDRLLWSCDLNWVRGEDSVVRALWAARPFVWQAYRQDAGAHRPKVDALLDHWLAGAALAPAAACAWQAAHAAWNDAPEPAAWAGTRNAMPALLQSLPALRAAAGRRTETLAGARSLSHRLVAFADDRL
jgi:uncharacterized repeat protein (TIGR03837 family)